MIINYILKSLTLFPNFEKIIALSEFETRSTFLQSIIFLPFRRSQTFDLAIFSISLPQKSK